MNRRRIFLSVSSDYPLEHLKANVLYGVQFELDEGTKYGSFFVLNGNIYYNLGSDTYICCSIQNLKKFITKDSIKQFLFKHKKIDIESVNDLCIMVMKCGYTREIDSDDYDEANGELKSDFRSRYKFDDFKFSESLELNPKAHPGDVLITQSRWGSIITLDMISDRRKQLVPDAIKDEISYHANNMLEENLMDIKDVAFLLYAEINFEVIGTLSKHFKISIIMIDGKREQLQEEHFCLCDCEDDMEDTMEEYFKNELFPDKATS